MDSEQENKIVLLAAFSVIINNRRKQLVKKNKFSAFGEGEYFRTVKFL